MSTARTIKRMTAKEVYNASKGRRICVRVPGVPGVSQFVYLHITRASLKIQYNEQKIFNVIIDGDGYLWIDGMSK